MNKIAELIIDKDTDLALLQGKEFDSVMIQETIPADLPSHLQLEDVLKGKMCPYCYQRTKYIDSIDVYRTQSFGMIYACLPCQAWVGVHHKTSRKALGRIANKELRQAKQRAHDIFDRLWKYDRMRREKAYAWLAREMNIDTDHCHIGMMNLAQCADVVEIVKKNYPQFR